MSDHGKNISDKDRIKAEREARLAQNLRDNLRRRKAASRKTKANTPAVKEP